MTTPLNSEPIVVNVAPALVEAKRNSPQGAPKWETETKERLRAWIKKTSRPLAELMSRDANPPARDLLYPPGRPS